MLVHELLLRGKSDHTAIITKEHRITYQILQQKVADCRDYLYGKGVKTGDKVAIVSHNNDNYIYAYFALVSLGAVVVAINYQLQPPETAYIVSDSNCVCILTENPIIFDKGRREEAFAADCPQYPITKCGEAVTQIHAPTKNDRISEDDVCVIIYTSGTTGKPKGAMLTHKNLTSNAAMFEKVLHVDEVDNVLCVLPMYHCFAWTCCILNGFYGGSCVTVMESFTPKETIDVINREKITVLYVVPSICSLLTKLAAAEELASVRLVVIGGTVLPVSVANAFSHKFGLVIAEGYGLSEAAPVVAVNPPGKEKIGSIGIPLPGIAIRIIQSDNTEVEPGQPGELLVRGDNVMPGYWNLPEATKNTIVDGWLHTGDIVRQDEDGYIYIVDRIKDMIISMGENIYPREIEELLYAYPGIDEAAVIGVPDRLRGQAGCCFFSVNKMQEVSVPLLKKYLRKNLALYKVPREFHKLDELPKTSTGKIVKRKLVELYKNKGMFTANDDGF
ncbi:class I adenylate-forming enzyme family protein [Pectinatus frisingensis]|uniref:class I adenylate-forming enzyme family protein n=1 Tax=Pectinatus frisingensis TaxID=865 RepID=UPI0018C77B6F|nr:AMP-binding protein [Pectinatus frisingensis]